LYRFLAITVLLDVKDIPQVGPLQWGRITAAEPFEALTEQAFSAQPKKLDRNIAAAEKAVEQARSVLSSDVVSELNERLVEIRSARRSNDRSRLALASVEGYRLLVTAAPQTKVPTAVSLLDYAGFRYDADLKSRPIRWSDMQAAIEFANRQWDSISDRITDPGLKSKFSATLQRMETAIARKAAAEAKTGVKTELDLVDKLERYFNLSNTSATTFGLLVFGRNSSAMPRRWSRSEM
jgi:hypothetical protein